MGKTVIHTNAALAHQVRLAKALATGTPGATISTSPDTPADVHIVMGPWFAFQKWKHATTLYIDRAYWGDPLCISAHWLERGEKVFTNISRERYRPQLKPLKSGDRLLTLCDYGEVRTGGTVRRHPADVAPRRTLAQELDAHDMAVGGRSTALVTAAIAGLRVTTDDPHSPVAGMTARAPWVTALAWHNWSINEIYWGSMWKFLQS